MSGRCMDSEHVSILPPHRELGYTQICSGLEPTKTALVIEAYFLSRQTKIRMHPHRATLHITSWALRSAASTIFYGYRLRTSRTITRSVKTSSVHPGRAFFSDIVLRRVGSLARRWRTPTTFSQLSHGKTRSMHRSASTRPTYKSSCASLQNRS